MSFIRESRDRSSSEEMEYSVPTDGAARPSSTCEMKLGETPTRLAISRTEMPAARRVCRSRCPRREPAVVSAPEPSLLDASTTTPYAKC
jgi:hypothetical protein